MNPLVSVICLCYNHERFVKEALLSVVNQNYSPIEIIVVDDFSKDGSVERIREFIKDYPGINFISNSGNIGNCRSFNKAFALSKGSYMIDFACDDVMIPERIAEQVKAFQKLDESYGVVYTNAENINEEGIVKGCDNPLGVDQPSGNIYKDVVERYFISPPTMMIKREVLERLGGYDESLAYEDFDFWVRSSRVYNYFFFNKVLTRRRTVSSSHSSKFNWKKNNPFTATTFKVIMKAAWLNQTDEERKALAKRVRYEFRHSGYISNMAFSEKYYNLLKKWGEANGIDKAFFILLKLKFPLPFFYQLLNKFRN